VILGVRVGLRAFFAMAGELAFFPPLLAIACVRAAATVEMGSSTP
jgi:hypothetical protein